MATKQTKFTVGLFVISGITIALVAIIWLGVSRIFEGGQYYVTYFDESVQGLNVDSEVKYRGVPVGRVVSISVAPNSKLIQVVMKMEADMSLTENIVAQLSSVGITGIKFIELDQKPPDAKDLSPDINFPTKYPVIASRPSRTKEIFQGLDDVLRKLSQAIDDLNVAALSGGIEDTLDSINTVFKNPKLDKAVDNAMSSLQRADSLLKKMENLVARNEQTIDSTMGNLHEAVTKANALVDTSQQSLATMQRNLMVTIQNLEQTSENLNELMDTIRDHPSKVFFGEPPSPKPVNDQ